VETNRKLRLRESICQYNITPIYIKGKDNQIADFLSRQVETNHFLTQISNLITMKRNFKREDDYSLEQELKKFKEKFNNEVENLKMELKQLMQVILATNQDLLEIQKQNLSLTKELEIVKSGKDAVGDRVTNLEEQMDSIRTINKLNEELVEQTAKNAQKCEEIAEGIKLSERERKIILLEQSQLFETKMEQLKETNKKIVASKHLRSDLKPGSKRHPLPMLVESLRESIETHGWLYRDIPTHSENTENPSNHVSQEENGLEQSTNENASNAINEEPPQPIETMTNEELTIETERRIRNTIDDVIIIEDELPNKRTRRN